MVSPNIRRPLQPHELEPMRQLGKHLRTLRHEAGLSSRHLARAALLTPRHVERIEQGTRRTRRSTLEALVDAMLLAHPDLGYRGALVAQLVQAAGPALAPESPHIAKTQARREAKRRRLDEWRALYSHLQE